MSKKYSSILFLFGSICFAAGSIFYLVRREANLYVVLNLAAGVVFLGIAAYYNLKDLSALFKTGGSPASRGMLLNTALVLGILVAVNLAAHTFYFGADLTSEKVSRISDQSAKVVQSLKDPVEILVFARDDKQELSQFILDSYTFASKRITYRFVDPEKNPQLAQQYGVTAANQAVVILKENHFLIPSVTEQDITNAIIRLTQNVKNFVYFIYGHGEHAVDDLKSQQGYGLLWAELQRENYTVFKLKLEPPRYYIPGDCTILVIAGPRRSFSEFEVKAVREYLENGGRALLMIDPQVTTGLAGLLKEWNVKAVDDCMVDVKVPSLAERALAAATGRAAVPKPQFQVMVNNFPEHEITNAFRDQAVIMSVARSIVMEDSATVKMDMKIEPIAQTTHWGWSATNVEEVFASGSISGVTEENRGPKIVGVVAVKGPAETSGKMIVLGDSDFVNNQYLQQLYNRDLFMNCMAYLARQANLISVRPRHLFASRIDYNPATMTRIFTVTVLAFPQLLLMAGIALWRFRQ
jgi:hypothetical protein